MDVAAPIFDADNVPTIGRLEIERAELHITKLAQLLALHDNCRDVIFQGANMAFQAILPVRHLTIEEKNGQNILVPRRGGLQEERPARGHARGRGGRDDGDGGIPIMDRDLGVDVYRDIGVGVGTGVDGDKDGARDGGGVRDEDETPRRKRERL
ncbi:Uncharacterized protein TCM_045336 [Theobroma cacao]|uniref:Uncharacterized protein n=1 Tax=Theobroma cacao TaxID=3641 RepID=A0A061FT62_THECC|nr:Uncharacterized protein TCM_045336 [Theobroma cacao]